MMEQWKWIIDSFRDGFLFVNTDYEIIYRNKAFLKLFGLKEDDDLKDGRPSDGQPSGNHTTSRNTNGD